MPTLHELQAAMRRSLVHHDRTAAEAMLAGHVSPDRLDIYRNTFLLTLTNALRLSFPAVEKLVGTPFFESAAQLFIAAHPPDVAWLDRYGAALPEFLREFEPAATVPYLHDVARLEWAVHSALHAENVEPLDPAALAVVAPEDQGRIRLVAEPSLTLLRLAYPADAIWRAVLLGDDEALAKIEVDAVSFDLLIERRAGGVEVTRLDCQSWQFLARLCAGDPLEVVLGDSQDGSSFDVASALAEHLAAGRFCRFDLAAQVEPASYDETAEWGIA
jgi:hypothetical protein